MKTDTENTENKGVTKREIHAQLKEIVAREMAGLPSLLEQLEPKERIRALLQLLPFTAPKVENCKTDFAEPNKWFFD